MINLEKALAGFPTQKEACLFYRVLTDELYRNDTSKNDFLWRVLENQRKKAEQVISSAKKGVIAEGCHKVSPNDMTQMTPSLRVDDSGNGGHGKRPLFKGDIGTEIDWVHISGYFTDPVIFSRVVGDNLGVLQGNRVAMDFGFGKFQLYSSGKFDLVFDSSREISVYFVENMLKGLAAYANCDVKFRLSGTESTVKARDGSALAKKIEEVVNNENVITKAQIFEPVGHLKNYYSSESKLWRLEDNNQFKQIIQGIKDFMDSKLPDASYNDRLFCFFSPIQEESLSGLQTVVTELDQKVGTLEESTQALIHSNIGLVNHNKHLSENVVLLQELMSRHDQNITDVLLQQVYPGIEETISLTKEVLKSQKETNEAITTISESITEIKELLRSRIHGYGRGHDLRDRIIEILSQDQDQSIQEIAKNVGRPYHTVYYHVQKLKESGFLSEEKKKRKKGPGRPRIVFSVKLNDSQFCAAPGSETQHLNLDDSHIQQQDQLRKSHRKRRKSRRRKN
jgi:predicted transcriptional regulator